MTREREKKNPSSRRDFIAIARFNQSDKFQLVNRRKAGHENTPYILQKRSALRDLW